MSNGALENGVYSATKPGIPSSITSGAVLMAENELFDRVYVKETDKKTKSLTINISNGVALEGKEETDCNNQHRRKISSARLSSPDEEAAAPCCSKKTKQYIRNVVVVIAVMVVVGLYSLGIIFFYTDVPENDNFEYETVRNHLLNQLEFCLESVSHLYSYTQVIYTLFILFFVL